MRKNIKINLTALKHKVQDLKGQSGMVKCLVIPIEANNLYHSDKTGNVYLDTVVFAIKEPKETEHGKNTEILKQSVLKDKYDSMSEDQRKSLPIIGTVFERNQAKSNNSVDEEYLPIESDELPF